MMKGITLLLACCIAITSAAPTAEDAVVPEEVLFQDASFEDTRSELAEMRAKGKSDKDCRKLADETEDDVKKSVAAQQAAIEQLDKGEKCVNEGQKDVTRLKNQVDNAKADKKKKDKAYQNAQNQKIDFGKFSYNELTPGQCGIFFKNSAWTNAHNSVKNAQQAAQKAAGYLTASEKAHKQAVADAQTAANKCACDVKKLHLKSVKAANDKAEAANKKAWKRAADLRCLLDGTPADKCKVTAIPTVKAVKLSKFAEGQQCSIIGSIGQLQMRSNYNNAVVVTVQYTGPDKVLTWDLERDMCKAAKRKCPGSTSYQNKYCAYSTSDDYIVTAGCNWQSQAFTHYAGAMPSGKAAFMCAHNHCNMVNTWKDGGVRKSTSGKQTIRKGDAVFCSSRTY
jgi:hypothetical protein